PPPPRRRCTWPAPPPDWPRCPRSLPSARPPRSCGSDATSLARRSAASSWAASASAAASASPNTPCWTSSPPPAPGRPAAMSSRGNLQRKCVKGHPKAAGKCSGRCIRYYPRLELPRGPDGRRRFEALGGYPTRKTAEAALADALARRSHGFALDPAKLTVDQYLDRWLAHVRGRLRARTMARYPALLRDHVRPHIGARPLKQLTPLEVQAIYDRLAISGRRDGKPGGLAPQHILAVHRCLHRALAQAVTWRLLAHNVATDAIPPPVPSTKVVTLAPEQVALLLDAAHRATSPWLGIWIVLAAATGARNGELCGLEWCDLDLGAGTVRFRQALTIIDPAVLPDDGDAR